MPDNPDQETIPLLEEQVTVRKTRSVTDRLRVSTTTEEKSVLIEDVLERGALTVERVAVDRAVFEAPGPRQEGDTLIVSIVEERLVVEKRFFVIEELRITRITATEQVTIPETIRTMRATIERAPPAPSTGRQTHG